MNKLPSISNYGNYSSDNYGAHTLRVDFSNLTLFYSYKTIVAFRYKSETIVCENIWGVTTGKHLNWIDGGRKNERLSKDEFESRLLSVLKILGLE